MSIFWKQCLLFSGSAFIGERPGKASPITWIPDVSNTFVEHSMGLKLCLDIWGIVAEVGVSGTVSIGLIGDILGLDMVLAVEYRCLVCFGVDWSETGLDVIWSYKQWVGVFSPLYSRTDAGARVTVYSNYGKNGRKRRPWQIADQVTKLANHKPASILNNQNFQFFLGMWSDICQGLSPFTCKYCGVLSSWEWACQDKVDNTLLYYSAAHCTIAASTKFISLWQLCDIFLTT